MAYFPAISLSFKESVAFNFGSRPLRYPLEVSWGSQEEEPAPAQLWMSGAACAGPNIQLMRPAFVHSTWYAIGQEGNKVLLIIPLAGS